MVAANESVAAELASRHIASLARFHDAPKLTKIEELTALLIGMGYSPGDLTQQRVLAKFLRRIVQTSPFQVHHLSSHCSSQVCPSYVFLPTPSHRVE